MLIFVVTHVTNWKR